MCGIFGGIGVTNEQARACLEAIRRGNDGITVRRYGDVVMGSRRHLVKASNKAGVGAGESDQPYDSDDRKIHLVFNGELYNFAELRGELKAKGIRFDTEGDTEVWLRLYESLGERFVDDPAKIDSLFSLGILDERAGKLLITRDWPGRIPLFYYYDPARRIFLFSSELKGFAPLPFVPLADPVELKPGHIAALDLATFELTLTQRFKPTPRKTAQPLLDVGRELHRLLKRSAANRTMGDVPICTMLSGGIDSVMTSFYVLSSIDWKNISYQPTSYVFAIENFVSEDVRRAAIAAEGFKPMGLVHKEIRVPGRQVVEDLPDIIRTFEMRKIKALSVYPLPIYYYLGPVMHADGFKVTIGGHGVDELLGAYDAWKELSASHKVQISTKSRLTFINNIYENMMRRASIIFMNRGPIEARFPFLETRVAEYMLGIDTRWLSISGETAEFLARQIEDRAGPRASWAPTVAATYDYIRGYLDAGAAPPKDADPTLVYEMEKLFWKLPLMVAGMHACAESFLPLHVLFSPKLRGQHGSGITSLEPMVVERYRALGANDGDIFKAIVRQAFNLPEELQAAQ